MRSCLPRKGVSLGGAVNLPKSLDSTLADAPPGQMADVERKNARFRWSSAKMLRTQVTNVQYPQNHLQGTGGTAPDSDLRLHNPVSAIWLHTGQFASRCFAWSVRSLRSQVWPIAALWVEYKSLLTHGLLEGVHRMQLPSSFIQIVTSGFLPVCGSRPGVRLTTFVAQLWSLAPSVIERFADLGAVMSEWSRQIAPSGCSCASSCWRLTTHHCLAGLGELFSETSLVSLFSSSASVSSNSS